MQCQYAPSSSWPCQEFHFACETLLLAKGILINMYTNGIHNVWMGLAPQLGNMWPINDIIHFLILLLCAENECSFILSGLIVIVFVIFPHLYKATTATHFCSTVNFIPPQLWMSYQQACKTWNSSGQNCVLEHAVLPARYT